MIPARHAPEVKYKGFISMTKMDEIYRDDSCLAKAAPSEMLFILLARECAAPATIRFWIGERIRTGKNSAEDEQLIEAEECAKKMEKAHDQFYSKDKLKQELCTCNNCGLRLTTFRKMQEHEAVCLGHSLSAMTGETVIIKPCIGDECALYRIEKASLQSDAVYKLELRKLSNGNSLNITGADIKSIETISRRYDGARIVFLRETVFYDSSALTWKLERTQHPAA